MDFSSRYDCGVPEVCLLFPMLSLFRFAASGRKYVDNKQISRRSDSNRDRSDDLLRMDPIHHGGAPLEQRYLWMSPSFTSSKLCLLLPHIYLPGLHLLFTACAAVSCPQVNRLVYRDSLSADQTEWICFRVFNCYGKFFFVLVVFLLEFFTSTCC